MKPLTAALCLSGASLAWIALADTPQIKRDRPVWSAPDAGGQLDSDIEILRDTIRDNPEIIKNPPLHAPAPTRNDETQAIGVLPAICKYYPNHPSCIGGADVH